MRFKWSILLLGVMVAGAAGKEKPKFTAGPVTSYPNRQAIDNVTIAASPLLNDSETQPAFGKLNPNKYGVLPVLVVIQNDTGRTLSLAALKAEYIMPDRDKVDATPAADLKYLSGADRPKVYTGPIPGRPPHVSKRKNPLKAWEIEGRAFTAKMLPAKESASGFFYFQAPFRAGSTLYLRGIRDAASGKEWFYFEIPLK